MPPRRTTRRPARAARATKLRTATPRPVKGRSLTVRLLEGAEHYTNVVPHRDEQTGDLYILTPGGAFVAQFANGFWVAILSLESEVAPHLKFTGDQVEPGDDDPDDEDADGEQPDEDEPELEGEESDSLANARGAKH